MSTINKYIWVVNALHRAGQRGLSLKKLNDKWLRDDISNGDELQRQTFNRWKGKILDLMGIIIECNLCNMIITLFSKSTATNYDLSQHPPFYSH